MHFPLRQRPSCSEQFLCWERSRTPASCDTRCELRDANLRSSIAAKPLILCSNICFELTQATENPARQPAGKGDWQTDESVHCASCQPRSGTNQPHANEVARVQLDLLQIYQVTHFDLVSKKVHENGSGWVQACIVCGSKAEKHLISAKACQV